MKEVIACIWPEPIGTVAIALSFPATPMAAVPTYAAQEILQRMLMTIAEIPSGVSADAEIKLRVGKPLSQPPDCVFRGCQGRERRSRP